MNPAERTACLLLAAGRSRRFGSDDKLVAMMAGRALADYAAATLGSFSFAAKLAVVAGPDAAVGPILRSRGFELAWGAESDLGMGGSIALGMRRLEPLPIDRILICLADMPFVSAPHVAALLDAAQSSDIVASIADGPPMPPVAFGRRWFGELGRLEHDQGPRALLAGAPAIPASTDELRDIDRIADL